MQSKQLKDSTELSMELGSGTVKFSDMGGVNFFKGHKLHKVKYGEEIGTGLLGEDMGFVYPSSSCWLVLSNIFAMYFSSNLHNLNRN